MLKDKKRIINWWMTWEDLNWPSIDMKDKIKRRAAEAAEANVTTAILFGAHFRWDWLPYFTLLHDHIGAIAEELHQYGIELYDRHSVNLIHRYDTVEEMRHVMLHSGPHIPFSPSREAAASWEYEGKRLNDWRMIDTRTREVLYYPQYASEGFCYRNPAFLEAYASYAKRLISDTGIDGLAAEDPVHYMHYSSCACPYCRAELKRRAGIDLPPASDREFWGNWANPAWKAWLDLRYESGKEFFEYLMPHLPNDFPVTTCGSNSASFGCNGSASDASRFVVGGSNYVHMEMSGNTPPYKNDPVTVNAPISSWMVGFSHHQAVAREAGLRAFSTGYGFSKPSANVIWALNKLLDADCCFSTLKARLGLPEHILKTLPEEPELIKGPYTFEKEHPELFAGEQMAQVGVFFSYETRNNSMFGNLQKGYNRDYFTALRSLSEAGISAHTILKIPTAPKEYPVMILSGVALLTNTEKARLKTYLSKGGVALVCGPTAIEECKNQWVLPHKPDIDDPKEFFTFIRDGVWHQNPKWMTETELAPIDAPDEWRMVSSGLIYNPQRLCKENAPALLEQVRRYAKKLPVEVISSKGYLTAIYRKENAYVVHFLAADYNTDIDHQLDEMRFHRSRVNYVNKAIPIGIDQKICIASELKPRVYLPLGGGEARIEYNSGVYEIILPKETAYIIVRFV